jgi:CheY-like chemotaxis protein
MSKGRVLVVDDSPIVRKMAEVALQEEGYEVFTAEDGEEGLKLTKEVLPSVILVDFIMPKLSGYQFCQAIRDEETLKDIPIILITGKGEDVGKKFLERFGVVDYFIKPFKSADLAQKVNSIIEMRESIFQTPEESIVVETLEEPPIFEPVGISEGGLEPPQVEPPVFELTETAPIFEPVGISEGGLEPPQVEPPVFELTETAPIFEPVGISEGGLEPPQVEPPVFESRDITSTEQIMQPQPLVSVAEEKKEMGTDIEKTVERVTKKFLGEEFQFIVQKSVSDLLKQAGVIKSTDILLSGHIATFAIIDILHLINLKKISAKLCVFADTYSADLYLDNNNILYASSRKQAVEASGETIKADMPETGDSSSGRLLASTKENIYNVLCSIMELESGSFTIEKIDASGNLLLSSPTPVNMTNAVIEASRLVNEKVFADIFNDSTKFIKIAPDSVLKNYDFNKSELIISACINGERSLSDIIDIINIEAAIGKRSFYVLLNAGVIKII